MDTSRHSPFAFWIPLISLAMALSVLGLIGFYTRYWADDYCFSGALREYGFLKAQVNYYLTASDRYSVLPLIGISEWFGSQAIRFLPAFGIVSWVVCLGVMCGQLIKKVSAMEIAILSGMGVFFSLLQAPNLFQALYWRSGLVTYLFPLIGQTLLTAWLIKLVLQRNTKFRTGIGLGILLFSWITGGFSETTAALQTTAILCSLLLIMIINRRNAEKFAIQYLWIAFIGTVLSMAVLFVSPAAQSRQLHFAAPPGVGAILIRSFRFSFDFMNDTLHSFPLPSFILFVFTLLMAFYTQTYASWKKVLWVMAGALVLGWVLTAACFAPSIFAQSSYAEDRALLSARYVVTLTIMALGWCSGSLGVEMVRRNKIVLSLALVAIVGLGLYPLRSAWISLQGVGFYKQRAELWDQRDMQIRQAVENQVQEIEAPIMDSYAALSEMNDDPAFWVNVCAAQYYGVQSIRTFQP